MLIFFILVICFSYRLRDINIINIGVVLKNVIGLVVFFMIMVIMIIIYEYI